MHRFKLQRLLAASRMLSGSESTTTGLVKDSYKSSSEFYTITTILPHLLTRLLSLMDGIT